MTTRKRWSLFSNRARRRAPLCDRLGEYNQLPRPWLLAMRQRRAASYSFGACMVAAAIGSFVTCVVFVLAMGGCR